MKNRRPFNARHLTADFSTYRDRGIDQAKRQSGGSKGASNKDIGPAVEFMQCRQWCSKAGLPVIGAQHFISELDIHIGYGHSPFEQ